MGAGRLGSLAHHRRAVLDRRVGSKRTGAFAHPGQPRDTTTRCRPVRMAQASEEHRQQMSTVELLSNPNVTARPTWRPSASSARPTRLRTVGAGLSLAMLDTSVVLVAFLAAYW